MLAKASSSRPARRSPSTGTPSLARWSSTSARSERKPGRRGRCLAQKPLRGLVVFPDATMTRLAPEMAAFAVRRRIPMISGWAEIARSGALASYGADLNEAYARVGGQVARILDGADPSLLPVEHPMRIYTTVSLKAAAAIGLTVPATDVARADEVIR
ncbi:MAG: ABC transporter substrate binding protein [Betaproteobacteria bacterium]